MKCLLKGLFLFILILSIIATAGIAFFFVSFKKDFEDIERRTRDIVAKIEAENA